MNQVRSCYPEIPEPQFASIKNQFIDALISSKSQPIPVIKPDIVFFGEQLPDSFHDQITIDKDHCDLVIVIGSSMKVRPVCLIPTSVKDEVPQVLINREPLGYPMRLGWSGSTAI